MRQTVSLVVAGAATLLQAFTAGAAKYTWVGPQTGGTWTDSANWSPSTGYPGSNSGYDDRAVFAPGDDVTVTVGGVMNCRYLDVSNGHVVVVSPNSSTSYHNMYRAGSVYVGEGAVLELTNARFKSYNDGTQTMSKNGKGLFSVTQVGSSSSKGVFASVAVKAGTFRVSGDFFGTNVVVNADAVLEMAGTAAFSGTTAGDAQVTVEAGGTLLWNSSKTCEFAGIAGAGEVRGTGTGELRFNLSKGPLAFSGVADGPKIALVNTKGLAADRFAYTVDGGVVRGGSESNEMNVVTGLRLPRGIRFDAAARAGTFCLTGGEAVINGTDQALPRRIEVTDGRLTIVRGDQAGAGAAAEEPTVLVADGARICLSGRNGAVTGSPATLSPFAQGAPARLCVGARGLGLAVVDTRINGEGVANVGYSDVTAALYQKFEGVGTDPRGPVEIRGYATWRHFGGFDDGGAVRLLDGVHLACGEEAFVARDGAAFGTGDLCLRGAVVGVGEELARAGALRLATGAGATLTYQDNAGVYIRKEAAESPRAVALGTLRRAGKGDVLFFIDNGRTIGAASGSTVTLAEAPAVDDLGVVLDPLFQSCNGNKQADMVLPFKYDAAKGLVSMALGDFTEGLTGGAYCKVTSAIYPSTDRALRGLCVAAKVGLAKGTTLTVGDGMHPAFVSFFGTGSEAFPDGSGCVDFGTSEGLLFFINNYNEGGVKLGCRLAGSNGISFCAPPEELRAAYVQLRARNGYTGGTRINGTVVGACAEGCFGSDDVYVNGGEFMGGAVSFETDGTWSNGFHVRGSGRRVEKYNKDPFGAMVFKSAVTLTGDIEIVEPTRMSVWTNLDSRITGTVSGDRLCLYSFRADKGGVLELAGHNTYTGGTEIVQQSVAVRSADGFGTGPVRVEKGTVVFRNTEPMTLANALGGTGKVRLEGAGVAFAAAEGFAATACEITAGEHVFTSDFAFRPLVSTAERAREAAVLVLKSGATYTLSQEDLQGHVDIDLESGATLDLGGNDLTVGRFTGNRADVVNGRILETRPRSGTVIVVR